MATENFFNLCGIAVERTKYNILKRNIIPGIKGKKGQIVLFIIIGIIIFISIGIILISYPKAKAGTVKAYEIYSIKNEVSSFTEDCIKQGIDNGILLFGKYGAQNIIPGHSIEADHGDDSGKYFGDIVNYSGDIALYYYNSQNLMQNISDWQEDLTISVFEEVNNCIAEYETFKNRVNINLSDELYAESQLSYDKIYFEFNFPTAITQGNSQIKLSEYKGEKKIYLYDLYSAVSEIVNRTIEFPEYIDYGLLFDAKDKYGFNISIVFYNNSINYIIEDSETMINNKPFRFSFAVSTETQGEED